ncbi:MAG TPA: vWA domain-containing protein [Vicinamibacterales bacterium]|nr:vWA domain-containing protein [Vicinamibacterales bacterium]
MDTGVLRALAQSLIGDWRAVTTDGVQFAYRDDPLLAAVALTGVALVVLAARLVMGARPARDAVAVPALFGPIRGSRLTWLRHLPIAVAGLGVPLALLALAEPFTALVSSTVTYPGRRIALMIDASDSMATSFKAATLNTRAETEPAFFTTVAAAKRFVELRRAGKYADLMALVEFGDRAYVITPFTSDYDNLLLSIALIGDPTEFSLFPDPGTVIASALEQSIELFTAFKFLEASGNLMVIFTDGEDTTSLARGRSLDDILKSAVDNAIPLYFVRTNYGKAFGDGIPDAQWQAAVEKTGGRYYVARDEASLLAAVHDIDRAAVGAIQVTRYTSRQPRFAILALGAAGCFLLAAALRLAVPQFSTFP